MNIRFNIGLFLILFTNSFNYIFSDCCNGDHHSHNQAEVPSNNLKEKENVDDLCNLELLDQIESEVTFLGAESSESVVLTRQKIFRRGYDGNQHTVEDLEYETLADQFSKVLKATVTNDDINRNLKKNGLGEKQILELAETWGYLNKDELFEDLKTMFRSQSAINFEIESQLIATQEEIERYYHDCITQYEESAQYLVETAFIPFSSNEAKETLFNELKEYAQHKIPKPSYIAWEDPINIEESEITKNNEFLVDLATGDIHIKEFEDGFNIYRMKNKRLRRAIPLDDVKEEIVLKLKQKKYFEAIKRVKEKLLNQAIIVHPTQVYSVPCSTKEFEIK